MGRNRGYQRIRLRPCGRDIASGGGFLASSLGEALQQVLALDGVRRTIHSPLIRELRLAGTPGATEQVGSGRVEQVIPIQLLGERFYQREAGVGPIGHRYRDRPVQLDHW